MMEIWAGRSWYAMSHGQDARGTLGHKTPPSINPWRVARIDVFFSGWRNGSWALLRENAEKIFWKSHMCNGQAQHASEHILLAKTPSRQPSQEGEAVKA